MCDQNLFCFFVQMCIKVCVLVWRRFGSAVKIYFVSSWFFLMCLKVMYIKLECTLNFTVGKFFYILSEENYIYSPLKMLLWERYLFFSVYVHYEHLYLIELDEFSGAMKTSINWSNIPPSPPNEKYNKRCSHKNWEHCLIVMNLLDQNETFLYVLFV